MNIRVLLVDDHPVVRACVRALLEAEPDLDVVGEAGSGGCAIELARQLRPDIVVADLLLPDMDGLAVTETVHHELPETRVLVLTSVGEASFPIVRAVRVGATAYLTTDADIHKLVRVIRSAAAGQVYLSPEAAFRIVEEVQAPSKRAGLTAREHEVLRGITIGRSNKEIARSLNITVTTVKSHVSVVLDKLEVQSRTQAALQALNSNLFSTDELAVS